VVCASICVAKPEGNTRFGKHVCEMKDNIKTDIKKKKGWHEMDLCGRGKEQLAGCCQQYNEFLGCEETWSSSCTAEKYRLVQKASA